jgi:bacteriorhodopsin
MGSLIMYINLVAAVTYVSHLVGWMAPVRDSTGKDIQIERYIEWMSDTPVMLFVISAAGNTMRRSIVLSWSSTIRMMVWDEIMLTLGLIHSISGNSTGGWICFWAGCASMVFTFLSIRSCVQQSVQSAATSYEIASIRGLECCTYGLWSLFPVIHFAFYHGWIDWLQYEIALTFVDVVTKCAYAVTLLTGKRNPKPQTPNLKP